MSRPWPNGANTKKEKKKDVWVSKSKRMKWAVHVRILEGKSDGFGGEKGLIRRLKACM
jgi:hypothetical protein